MDKSTHKNNTGKWPPMPFWHYFAELVTEPVLLTLAVVLAYNHFTSTTVWNRMGELPTGADMAVLILFFGAFIIWALVVVRRLRRESQKEGELNERFNQIAQSIDRLTDEIKKSRENK
jgi:cytochrome c oxidase assembly factor CtaG